MTSIPAAFPAEWTCDVVRERGGGRNSDGDPRPVTRTPLTRVLLAPRATTDPQDRSDVTTTTAVLYGAPGLDVTSSDVIVVPETHPMRGRWGVDGDPSFWPLGTEVPLRKG